MEDTTREELGQNQNANLAGTDVDDDGCEGVKMREGGWWVFTILCLSHFDGIFRIPWSRYKSCKLQEQMLTMMVVKA